MSPWDRSRFYAPTVKQPPPEHGIRMKKAGTTWWGQRWLSALEQLLRGDAGRLSRGRTYARAGRTHDLVVASGKVVAKVTGSRPTPYDVQIELARLADDCWQGAIAAMAAKAQFSAELLAGTMPEAIDDVFRSVNASLFPQRRSDLNTSCSCPDDGDPCKHIAATHYLLGEALDRDPFLLFELRGRTKEQVLAALRTARGVAPAEASNRARSAKRPSNSENAETSVAKVTLGKIRAADYDKPREPLPALHFSFDPPASHGAVLQQLGAPAAWHGESSPADAFTPLVTAAAEIARKIALAEREPSPLSVEPSLAVARTTAPPPPAAIKNRGSRVKQPPKSRAPRKTR